MRISLACKCGKKLTTSAQNAGKRVRCPSCSSLVPIPHEGGTSEADIEDEQCASINSQDYVEGEDGSDRPKKRTKTKRKSKKHMLADRTRGMLLGLLLGILALAVGGAVVGVSAGAEPNPIGIVAGLTVISLGIAAMVVAPLGSYTELNLAWTQGANAELVIIKKLAFYPAFTQVIDLTPSDQLIKTAKSPSKVMVSKGVIDIVAIIIGIGLLAAGLIPGILFFVMWHRQREYADSGAAIVTLTVKTRRPKQTYQLWKKLVPDYYGTRFGDPKDLRKLIQFFQDHSQISFVEDV